MQHAGNDAFAAVIDLDLTGDHADARRAERSGESEQSVGSDDAVGIDGDEDFAGSEAESGGEGGALAAVAFQTQGTDAVAVAGDSVLDMLPGVVGAAVVDDDNLKAGGVVVCGSHRVNGLARPCGPRYRRG